MMVAIVAALVLAPAGGAWEPVEISYYTYGKRTADGTPMKLDGRWVATRKFPLGSIVEVRYGGKTLRLPVKDKTAKRTGHRADLPRDTWRLYGAPLSRGILRGQWRRVK